MKISSLEQRFISLKGNLFQKILFYLDSCSIQNFVLVCKQIRYKVGEEINVAICVQQIYSHEQADIYNSFKDIFDEYDELLINLLNQFKNKDYIKIILSLNMKNQVFFQDFFKCVLNYSSIQNDKLFHKKFQLKELGPKVLEKIQQIYKSSDIPQLNSNEDYMKLEQQISIQVQFARNKNKLLKLFTQFLTIIQNLTQQQASRDEYREYKLSKNYLEKTKIIKPKYGIYERIIQFKNGKSFYNYSNYNITSLIVEFLSFYEMTELRFVSKWFYNQIPGMMKNHIFQNKRPHFNEYQQLLKELEQHDIQLIKLVLKNQKFKLERKEIAYYLNSGMKTINLELLKLLFDVISERVLFPQETNSYYFEKIKEKYIRKFNIMNFQNSEYYSGNTCIYSEDFYYQLKSHQMDKMSRSFLINTFFLTKKSRDKIQSRLYYSIMINYILTQQKKDKQYYSQVTTFIKQNLQQLPTLIRISHIINNIQLRPY